MTESEQEKKNKRIAAISTAGITVVVLVLLFVIIAWRAPDPPLPEYGIEINFGVDDAGFGEVQPRVTPGEPEATPEEVTEEEPVESEPVPPVESEPEEQPIVSKIESPVAVKEEEPKKESPPAEEPRKKEPEPVREPVKEPVKETPKPPVPKAVYKPNTATNEAGSREGDATSHGYDPGRTGDKGNPQGNVDSKALYGKPGGGAGGTSLDLAGWVWDAKPAPSIPPEELGGVVRFEIKVDDRGEIISIRTLERGVRPETELACRKAIESLTFSKTGENVPPVSTGTVTFVIRAR
jgi:hypothetical protein